MVVIVSDHQAEGIRSCSSRDSTKAWRRPHRWEPGVNGDGGDSNGFALDELIGDEPSPDLVVILEEQHQRLLGLLRDDRLRQVAVFRIEGLAVPEIAAELQVTTRSIERKLALIRGAWSKELES